MPAELVRAIRSELAARRFAEFATSTRRLPSTPGSDQGVFVGDDSLLLGVTAAEAAENGLQHVFRIDLAVQTSVEVLADQGDQPLGVAL